MNPSISDILSPLDPHWDRISRQPISSEEVDELESQVGLPMPVPLRDYLMAVGLFQDLTRWNASNIEVYERSSEFVDARQFLCELLPTKKQDLFPFGDDGSGNVFCLPTAADVPCRIHFVDHETCKVSKRKDFTVWLQAVVAKVVRGIRRRVPNEFKIWAVQFCFYGIRFEELSVLLASLAQIREIDSDWMNFDTTSEGVTSTDRRIELNAEEVKVRRLECPDWNDSLVSFDMRESIAKGFENSQIRKFDALFKNKCSGYRLVDYGPLDSRQLEKAEREGSN